MAALYGLKDVAFLSLSVYRFVYQKATLFVYLGPKQARLILKIKELGQVLDPCVSPFEKTFSLAYRKQGMPLEFGLSNARYLKKESVISVRWGLEQDGIED